MLAIDRITSNPNIMNGKPCIRGICITVSLVVNLVTNGISKEDILGNYPILEIEDIDQCLQYDKYYSKKFAGKLPIDAAKKLQDHIKRSRNEWDITK
jgi:uncharacterized protein (DUF433 family)